MVPERESHTRFGHTRGMVPLLALITMVVSTQALPVGWTPDLAQAAMEVTAWEEGRNCAVCPRGDQGRSVTTWQIWARDEAHRRQLEADAGLAARTALQAMTDGARLCPEHPLAPYCGGCDVLAAQEIGDRRLATAQFMVELRRRLHYRYAATTSADARDR